MKQDYYETLGVSKDANDDTLKKAYRRMAMKYHPDRNPNDQEAEKKFKYINEAYNVLSDSDKRSIYDRYGHAGLEGAAGAGGGGGGFSGFGGESVFDDLGDIFNEFMGGDRGFRQQASRGHDLSYQISLSFEEAVMGTEKEIQFQAHGQCTHCDGKGAVSASDIKTCSTCQGSGHVRIQQGFISLQQPCHTCRGQGKVIKNPCSHCHGQGQVKKQKRLKVSIPAGIEDGNRMRMTGEGEFAGPGSTPGDLYIDISVKPHDIFKRQGNHLHCEVPIQFAEAALGAEIQIPTIQGKVSVKIPAETQSGATFRLRGKGVKGIQSRSVGDLICKVTVETPTRLNDKQKKMLSDFQNEVNNDGPRHTQKQKKWLDKVKGFLEKIGIS